LYGLGAKPEKRKNLKNLKNPTTLVLVQAPLPWSCEGVARRLARQAAEERASQRLHQSRTEGSAQQLLAGQLSPQVRLLELLPCLPRQPGQVFL
jgi:hypothetical protein